MVRSCLDLLGYFLYCLIVWMITAIFLFYSIGVMRIGIEFAVMLARQMFFFIRTVHFNEILGTFDKTASKE